MPKIFEETSRNVLINRRIGQNLKRVRNMRKLSREVIADIIEGNEHEVEDFEEGRSIMIAAELVLLCAHLELPIEAFVLGDDEAQPISRVIN